MDVVISRIRLVAIYVGLLLPVIVFGALNALKSSNNSPIDWVDANFAERRQYDEFVELFGPGDVVIASWPECFWTDERLDLLTNELRQSPLFRDSSGESLLYQVVCGREVVLKLTQATTTSETQRQTSDEEPDSQVTTPGLVASEMTPEVAVQRLQGSLIGPDGRTTCVIVTLNKAGLAVRADVVAAIQESIRNCCQVQPADIHLAGPVIDGLTVDAASHQSLTKFAAPSAIVIFIICWWSLRSVIGGLVVFLTACFCQAVVLAVIHYTGETLSALLIILPPLVQVLTVSGGIHLMNYYQNAATSLSPQAAAIEAFRKGWLPSVLSLGTTAMGTASLMVSGLEPIRLFGIYGTIGVLTTTATVLAVIPCSMILIGRRTQSPIDHVQLNVNSGKHPTLSENEGSHALEHSETSGFWRWLTSLLDRRNSFALLVLLGLMLTGIAGLPKLQTSIRIETLFPHNSRIMQDYEWLEKHLGPLVPIEVLLTFDKTCRMNDRLKMDLLWRINDSVQKHSSVHATTSALTVFPRLPSMESLPDKIKAAMLNKAVHLARPAFHEMGTLRSTENGEVWRLTAHVSALEPLDYGEILGTVRKVVLEELYSQKQLPKGVTVTTSGIMPLVHQIQGQLLTDLFSSLMSACVVITLTLTIIEAGIVSGILAMASNVFPIVVAFGWMGWLQHPMDIGSVMTASIALGIAVDDTLHFLAFFRRTVNQESVSRFAAVVSAYQHCGVAMIQTSVSCGIGLLVFAFSDFVPTSRFAILMAILLMLALLGDLLLLPALLLSPAGRFFAPNSSRHSTESTPTPH
jgi:predicted RND superfamily exporter protein